MQVPVTTLDALLATYGNSASVKLDIEGSELAALAGLGTPVKGLCFEFQCPLLDEVRVSLNVLDTLGTASADSPTARWSAPTTRAPPSPRSRATAVAAWDPAMSSPASPPKCVTARSEARTRRVRLSLVSRGVVDKNPR